MATTSPSTAGLEGVRHAQLGAGISNEPMAWNDRANRVLLQQMFIGRVERTVVTTRWTMPTRGFRSDWEMLRLGLSLHAAPRHLQQPAASTAPSTR